MFAPLRKHLLYFWFLNYDALLAHYPVGAMFCQDDNEAKILALKNKHSANLAHVDIQLGEDASAAVDAAHVQGTVHA